MEILRNTKEEYMEFRIDRQNFLIPLSSVVKVMGEEDREDSLPVLDFYKLAGLPKQRPGGRNHILVIENHGEYFGLLVQEVIGIQNITGDICEIPAEIKTGENTYLLCVVHSRDKTPCFAWILDVPALYEKVDFGNDE